MLFGPGRPPTGVVLSANLCDLVPPISTQVSIKEMFCEPVIVSKIIFPVPFCMTAGELAADSETEPEELASVDRALGWGQITCS